MSEYFMENLEACVRNKLAGHQLPIPPSEVTVGRYEEIIDGEKKEILRATVSVDGEKYGFEYTADSENRISHSGMQDLVERVADRHVEKLREDIWEAEVLDRLDYTGYA